MIITPDGQCIPIQIRDGLAYIDMHEATTNMNQMSIQIWKLDLNHLMLMRTSVSTLTEISNFELLVDTTILEARLHQEEKLNPLREFNKRNFTRTTTDWDLLRKNFGWVPGIRIKETLEKSTAHYRARLSLHSGLSNAEER